MDVTKTVTIEGYNMQAGDATLRLPNATGDLLSSASDINPAKIDINSQAAAAGGAASADEVLVYDASATANKKLALSDLKTFVNEGISSLPSSANNNILVSNATTFESHAMTGDITNALGVMSIADNAVVTDHIVDDAITGAKIAPLDWLTYEHGGGTARISSADGQKMFVWECEDNKLTLKYSSDGGSSQNVVQEWEYV
jgi:hypothetical protein